MREERQLDNNRYEESTKQGQEDKNEMSSLSLSSFHPEEEEEEEEKSNSLDQLLSKAIRDKNGQQEISGIFYSIMTAFLSYII